MLDSINCKVVSDSVTLTTGTYSGQDLKCILVLISVSDESIKQEVATLHGVVSHRQSNRYNEDYAAGYNAGVAAYKGVYPWL